MENISPGRPYAPVADNPEAPEVFSTEVRGFFLLNGNVHITLASKRGDYSKQPTVFYDIVVARLVIPIDSAEMLAAELAKFVKQMKGQPVATSDAPRTLQ